MRIIIKTRVNSHFLDVFEKFDKELFMALKPKFGKIEILEFTGSDVGNKVHVRFLKPIKADWKSEIKERSISENEAFFIDEGTHLPPGMKFWKHKHVIKKISENKSEIIDDITFSGNNLILSLLLYPALFVGFYPRKKQYIRYFLNKL